MGSAGVPVLGISAVVPATINDEPPVHPTAADTAAAAECIAVPEASSQLAQLSVQSSLEVSPLATDLDLID